MTRGGVRASIRLEFFSFIHTRVCVCWEKKCWREPEEAFCFVCQGELWAEKRRSTEMKNTKCVTAYFYFSLSSFEREAKVSNPLFSLKENVRQWMNRPVDEKALLLLLQQQQQLLCRHRRRALLASLHLLRRTFFKCSSPLNATHMGNHLDGGGAGWSQIELECDMECDGGEIWNSSSFL